MTMSDARSSFLENGWTELCQCEPNSVALHGEQSFSFLPWIDQADTYRSPLY